ncbi:hypothetical protein SAMN04244553_5437 [Nocardia amikacinitolerans]|uniref:Uncharacterized protein n=1 Tax=Nocardia amikacinitolerans TaxID=756689 RepID=A0A285LVG6_9NOCA|nr:hypothetical protein [Nocardia amikacinitolerans]SNY88463.1 hypothetical protein SAMN04244553_5437 [Nocardia amikacinitolerans]
MLNVALTTVSITCIATALLTLTAGGITDSLAARAIKSSESCFIGDIVPTDKFFENRQRHERLHRITVRLMMSGLVTLVVGIAVLGLAAWQFIHTAR